MSGFGREDSVVARANQLGEQNAFHFTLDLNLSPLLALWNN